MSMGILIKIYNSQKTDSWGEGQRIFGSERGTVGRHDIDSNARVADRDSMVPLAFSRLNINLSDSPGQLCPTSK